MNLIFINVPYRYDLHNDVIENQLIKKLNCKIKRFSSNSGYPYTDLWTLKRLYRLLGLYLNKKGKNWFASLLKINIINNISGKLNLKCIFMCIYYYYS